MTESVDHSSTTSIDGTKDIDALDAETDLEPLIEDSTEKVASVGVKSPVPKLDGEPIEGVPVHLAPERPELESELDALDRHDGVESHPQTIFDGVINTQAGETQTVEDDRPEKHPALSLAHVLIANEDQTLPAWTAMFAPSSSSSPVADVYPSRQTTFLARGTSRHVDSQAPKEPQDDRFASILMTSAEVDATAHDHARPSFGPEASVEMDVQPSSLSERVGSDYNYSTTCYGMQDGGGPLPSSKQILSTPLDRNPTTQTPCRLGQGDDQTGNIIEDSMKLSKKNGPPHTQKGLQLDPTAERLRYDTDRAVRLDRRDRLAAEISSRAIQTLKTCLTGSGSFRLHTRELLQETQHLNSDLAPLNGGGIVSRKRKAADDVGSPVFTEDISKRLKTRHDRRSVTDYDDPLETRLPDAPEAARSQALRSTGKRGSQPIGGDDGRLPPRKKSRKSEPTNDRFSRIKSAARTLAGVAVGGVGVFAYLAASNPDPI